MVLVLATLEASLAHAQGAQDQADPSVVVYGQTQSPNAQEVLPDGVIWNRPMKAGEMVLPRQTKEKKAAPAAPVAPRMPVGEIKAPQLSASDSTTSVMMLQGMKNALQQSGQNTDIPKSSAVTAPAALGDDPVMIDVMSMDKAASATTTAPAPTPILSAPQKSGSSFEKGQAPKSLSMKADAKTTEAAPAAKEAAGFKDELSEETYIDANDTKADNIVFPPEMAKSSNKAASKPAKGASVFGAPVDEPNAADETVIDTDAAEAPAPAKVAEPQKETRSFWSRLFGSSESDKKTESKPAAASNATSHVEGDEAVIDLGGEDSPATAAAMQESEPAAAPAAVNSHSPDGSCGVANGMPAASKPSSGSLCQSGSASAVTGSGPWRWSCKGSTGGMTVSCAAPLDTSSAAAQTAASASSASSASATQPIDGLCGEATEQGTDKAPSKGLCVKGTPSRVNGSGPWTWACSGANGGQAAACTAHSKTDGACGRAAHEGTDYMPAQDLCTSGMPSAVSGSGPWHWTCSGLYGGEASTCSAMPKQNAICGAASLTGHSAAPTDELCNVGKPTALSGEGPWSWQCAGSHGGATVSCSAPKMADGVCGPAHGSPFTKTPTSGLCSAGRASRVTGLGPWSWNCMGEDGGQTVNCVASLGSAEAVESVMRCGAAAETLSFSKPSDRLCATGSASAVTGNGPWSWTCADDAGHQTNCTTLSSSDGECGSATKMATSQEPRSGLCEKGTPSAVKSDRSANAWTWECAGSLGGAAKGCSAPMGRAAMESSPFKSASADNASAKCGASASRSLTSAPTDDLCLSGKPTAVHGTGPWKWSCEGKGKAKVMCESALMSDGICGAVNGTIQRAAPRSDLCASGQATEVTGSGPWMWSCVGSGGGNSVSCSAASQAHTKVDGTCGAAANAVMPAAPTANLCDSGVASAVNGAGPWTWTCSGMNGGIASTCTTSKVMPKAPAPPGPLENGVCGPSNGVAFDSKPTDGLCAGGMASETSGNGPWNWSCIGVNGGMTVSCTAPLTPPPPVVGICGASSGVPTLTKPKASLCSAGIASAVSGNGPWTWSCSGTNGGTAVSCVAPKAGGSVSGTPSLTTPSLDGEAPPPLAAPRGLVTPQLTAEKLAPLKKGTVPNLTPSQSLPPMSDGGAVKDLSAASPVKAAAVVNGLAPEASSIPFTLGSDALSKEATASLTKVIAYMSSHPTARLSLVAYATTDGKISPRQARRISLDRALAVRDYLGEQGVDSGRIDVKPMGANVPSGDMDRVDVLVN